MVKIVDNRTRAKALIFENVEYGRPFCFLHQPEKIFVVITDDTMAEITNEFFAYDPKHFSDVDECQYVDLKIEIT